MELLNVIIAGIGGFAFGAIWYMVFANPWMAASGVPLKDGKPANSSDPMTYIIGLICAIVVAGMMRHVFVLSDIDTVAKGLVSGLGVGAFLAAPWLVTNYTFAARSRTLILIDAGYAAGGCTVIGFILTLF